MQHGRMGNRATGPELWWPLAGWEAQLSDSCSERRKRRGRSHDSGSHAQHIGAVHQWHTSLDTQALAVLVQDDEDAALGRAGEAGRPGDALERRLRRLGGRIQETLASPCLDSMLGSETHMLGGGWWRIPSLEREHARLKPYRSEWGSTVMPRRRAYPTLLS